MKKNRKHREDQNALCGVESLGDRPSGNEFYERPALCRAEPLSRYAEMGEAGEKYGLCH